VPKTPRGALDRRFVALPLSLAVWAGYVLIVVLWTPAMGAFRLLTRRADPGRRRVGRLLRRAAVCAVGINPFWEFDAIDPVHPDPARPHLFVSNHRSVADVFLLCLLPWEMKFLSKRSVFRIPLLGWQMRLAGDVAVERGDKDSARRALEQLRRRLLEGSSVIVFPEGTRRSDGAVAPFRDGAFRLAIESGVDVVPLAVRGTERALPVHSLVFRRTAASVTVLPPLATAGLAPGDAPGLAESARLRIAEALGVAAPPQSALR
jgi:1-acyl-sn-glycerol-3-phosphate acyltransferase